MNAYSHVCKVSAQGSAAGMVLVASSGLPNFESGPPPELDGPGGIWSPESPRAAAVAGCFILTFRAVARATQFGWEQLSCEVEGTPDQVSGVTQFIRYTTGATLTVKAGADHTKAEQLLERVETICLIANSLRGERGIQDH